MAGDFQNTQRGGLHAYSIRVPANGNTKRTIRGTTIRVADSPVPIQITAHAKKLNGQRGTNFTLEMKKFEKWFTDIEYDEIEITNTTADTIVVTLQLGYGDFEAEILSRTLAAPTIIVDEVDMTCTLGNGDIPSPLNGGIVALVPENSQRKRIKIAAYVYNYVATGSPNSAVYFGISDLEFIVEIGPPVYPFLHEGSGGPVFLAEGSEFAADHPLFLGEIELETTDAIFAHSVLHGTTAADTFHTYQLRFKYVEEVYSAS